MSKKTAPVWAWTVGAIEPVISGEFQWDTINKVGRFQYDAAYLEYQDRFALDPVALPFRRSPLSETRQEGIFGVFRDSGPDSWGRSRLLHESVGLDEFDFLSSGPGDGVGALSIGDRAHSFTACTLDEIDDVSRSIGVIQHDKKPIVDAVRQTTSMGGAKPKLTVFHEEQYWIAKFPDIGDSPYLAHNEHVMLEIAKSCGIRSCHSKIHSLPDGRRILLVKRFDLELKPAGLARSAFASAHTVLGLGAGEIADAKNKSYLKLAEGIRRWCNEALAKDGRRELWLRAAFNSMVGNGDDHSRNHGLLRAEGLWQLSPAFDIVAAPRGRGVPIALALRIHGDTFTASPEALVASASDFSIPQEFAVRILKLMAARILDQWRTRLHDSGASGEEIERLAPAFTLAEQIDSADLAPMPAPEKKRFMRNTKRTGNETFSEDDMTDLVRPEF